MHMMSRAGKVVVVSGTVVSGAVVSTTVGRVSETVESTSTNELVTSLEALGVLLTAQAESTTKPRAIRTLEGRKKRTLLRAINKYYANHCYF
jgi:fucose permease